MTADKGMAGAYNHNVLKLAQERLAQGNDNTLFVIGQMGRKYFTKKNVRIDMEFLYTAQDPSMWRARNIAETLVDLYRKEKLDEIYIIYTKMVTPLKAEPEIIQILPLKRQSFEEMNVELEKYHKIADYSPSPKVVMDHFGAQLCERTDLRSPGRVIFQRAECAYDGDAGGYGKCKRHDQGAVAFV
nr:FoF1 ATP synthase subunit gamma [Anaerostipes caccae]